MIKLIIAGSRNFDDFARVEQAVDQFRSPNPSIPMEIVSGGAKGTDKLGERYAHENGIPIKLFPANWEKWGRAAGPIRNKEMSQYATHLIAFWDGRSRGTASMIKLAKGNLGFIKIVSI